VRLRRGNCVRPEDKRKKNSEEEEEAVKRKKNKEFSGKLFSPS